MNRLKRLLLITGILALIFTTYAFYQNFAENHQINIKLLRTIILYASPVFLAAFSVILLIIIIKAKIKTWAKVVWLVLCLPLALLDLTMVVGAVDWSGRFYYVVKKIYQNVDDPKQYYAEIAQDSTSVFISSHALVKNAGFILYIDEISDQDLNGRWIEVEKEIGDPVVFSFVNGEKEVIRDGATLVARIENAVKNERIFVGGDIVVNEPILIENKSGLYIATGQGEQIADISVSGNRSPVLTIKDCRDLFIYQLHLIGDLQMENSLVEVKNSSKIYFHSNVMRVGKTGITVDASSDSIQFVSNEFGKFSEAALVLNNRQGSLNGNSFVDNATNGDYQLNHPDQKYEILSNVLDNTSYLVDLGEYVRRINMDMGSLDSETLSTDIGTWDDRVTYYFRPESGETVKMEVQLTQLYITEDISFWYKDGAVVYVHRVIHTEHEDLSGEEEEVPPPEREIRHTWIMGDNIIKDDWTRGYLDENGEFIADETDNSITPEYLYEVTYEAEAYFNLQKLDRPLEKDDFMVEND